MRFRTALSLAFIGCSGLFLAACVTNSTIPNDESLCATFLDEGYSQIKLSEANSLKGTANFTAASTLLTTASTQKGVGDYDGCIVNAKKAIQYIQENKKDYNATN